MSNGFGIRFITAVMLLGFGLFALAGSYYAFRRVAWPSKWALGRSLRFVRRAIHLSPAAEGCYFLTFVLLCTTAWFLTYDPPPRGAVNLASAVAYATAAVGAVIDIGQRISALLRYKAVRAFALLAVGFGGTAAFFIAGVLGRQFVQASVGFDAKLFPDTVQIAAVIAYPLALLIVACFAGIFIALVEQFILLVVGAPWLLLATVLTYMPKKKALRFQQMLARLADRKPRTKQPWYVPILNGFHLLVRPVAVILIAISLTAPVNGLYSLMAGTVGTPLRYLAAAIEFAPNKDQCPLVATSAQIAKLSTSSVLVLIQPAGGKLEFLPMRCRLEQ